MSVDQLKAKQLCLTSTLLAMIISAQCPSGWATYSDVGAMLEAFRPVAPVQSPEINTLIIALDALPSQDRIDALQTLAPLADGSLRAASDGAMRQVLCVIGDRLMKVQYDSGVSSGDEYDKKEIKKGNKAKKPDANKEVNSSTETENKTEEKVTEQAKAKSTSEKADTQAVEDNKQDVAQEDKDTQRDEECIDDNKVKRIRGVWAQLLGSEITQNDRHNVPGYRADVLGAVIGRDVLIGTHFTLGIAGGYQHSNVTSRNSSGSNLDIERYQGTLYGRYDLDCPIYMLAALTAAANSYDTNRHILVPPYAGTPIVNIAHSKFTGWEANAYFETGYIWRNGNFRAIPKAMLMYSHFSFETFIEHDAFGLDLNVKYDSMDALPVGAGIQFDYINEFEKVYVIPEIHLNAFTDSVNDRQEATGQMTGGGYAFLSTGAVPASGSIEVGAGLAVHSYKNTSFTIQYDYTARSDYHRHSAFIKLRHEWAK